MNRVRRPFGFAMLGAALLLAAPADSQACTVCVADSNSPIAGASNGAIFVMLGAIGMMLAATVAVGVYLVWRARRPLSTTPEGSNFSSDTHPSSHA